VHQVREGDLSVLKYFFRLMTFHALHKQKKNTRKTNETWKICTGGRKIFVFLPIWNLDKFLNFRDFVSKSNLQMADFFVCVFLSLAQKS
jgi:hypothetical protein